MITKFTLLPTKPPSVRELSPYRATPSTPTARAESPNSPEITTPEITA